MTKKTSEDYKRRSSKSSSGKHRTPSRTSKSSHSHNKSHSHSKKGKPSKQGSKSGTKPTAKSKGKKKASQSQDHSLMRKETKGELLNKSGQKEERGRSRTSHSSKKHGQSHSAPPSKGQSQPSSRSPGTSSLAKEERTAKRKAKKQAKKMLNHSGTGSGETAGEPAEPFVDDRAPRLAKEDRERKFRDSQQQQSQQQETAQPSQQSAPPPGGKRKGHFYIVDNVPVFSAEVPGAAAMTPSALVQSRNHRSDASAAGPTILFDRWKGAFADQEALKLQAKAALLANRPALADAGHLPQPDAARPSGEGPSGEAQGGSRTFGPAEEFILLPDSESEGGDRVAEGGPETVLDDAPHNLDGTDLPPWATRGPYTSGDVAVNLHNEILDFAQFCVLTDEEDAARRQVVKDVENEVKALFPGAELHLFGSYASDLHLPSSDIDMVVVHPDLKTVPALREIATSLRVKGIASSVTVLEKAKVPIAKFVHYKSGFACDICVNVLNGPDCLKEMRAYMHDFPQLKPLLLVLKQFLADRGLNEPFKGGMGSYMLCLTVLSHLQLLTTNFPWFWRRETFLGDLLAYYLKLYGKDLNHVVVGLAVTAGGHYSVKEEASEMLQVIDPQNPESDIGRSCFKYFNVRSAMNHAFMNLSAGEGATPLSNMLSTDDHAMAKRAARIRHAATTQREIYTPRVWARTHQGKLEAVLAGPPVGGKHHRHASDARENGGTKRDEEAATSELEEGEVRRHGKTDAKRGATHSHGASRARDPSMEPEERPSKRTKGSSERGEGKDDKVQQQQQPFSFKPRHTRFIDINDA